MLPPTRTQLYIVSIRFRHKISSDSKTDPCPYLVKYIPEVLKKF